MKKGGGEPTAKHPTPKGTAAKRPARRVRNFITDVLIPSFFLKKSGCRQRPIFPRLTAGQICLTWIGHASFLIQTDRHNLLVDPNWANWMMAIRRLRHAGILARDLPSIDLVMVTHAHFDHLDRRSLKQVADRQPIVVPTGVKGLVKNLGFHSVHEMEWWDKWEWKGLEIIFTPAMHWGARVLADGHRGYGGFLIRYQGRSVFHVGDTAYFKGFSEVGKRYSPEIVLMPIGAYDPPSGRDVHISPELAVKAFQDLGGKQLIPMHYGTYRMSFEPIHEPPQRLMASAAQAGILQQVKFLTEGLPEIF